MAGGRASRMLVSRASKSSAACAYRTTSRALSSLSDASSPALMGRSGPFPLAWGLLAKEVIPLRLEGNVRLSTSIESSYRSMRPTKAQPVSLALATPSILSPALATAPRTASNTWSSISGPGFLPAFSMSSALLATASALAFAPRLKASSSAVSSPVPVPEPRKRVMRFALPTRHAGQRSHAEKVPTRRFSSIGAFGSKVKL
mmetsp:Transcript_4715/g.11074  ORF Transcript_4715/g.11074 Transcript_4715/m.11074 type:complete len:202 (+) Transcript_4715:453-1058(+)